MLTTTPLPPPPQNFAETPPPIPQLFRNCLFYKKSLFVVPNHFRVLSRIYRLGEKSRLAGGDKLPKGVPWKFFEMNMRWDVIWCILRHNFEKCYGVCTDLVVSGWFFQYSYSYTVIITIFWGKKLGILGGKLLHLKYPRQNPAFIWYFVVLFWVIASIRMSYFSKVSSWFTRLLYCSSTDKMHSSSTRLPHSTSLRPSYSSLWTLSSQVMPCSLSRSLVSPTNSPLKKREVDWVEFAFAKPSGTVARGTKKNWPIADRRVPSNNPRNNCVTYFYYSRL